MCHQFFSLEIGGGVPAFRVSATISATTTSLRLKRHPSAGLHNVFFYAQPAYPHHCLLDSCRSLGPEIFICLKDMQKILMAQLCEPTVDTFMQSCTQLTLKLWLDSVKKPKIGMWHTEPHQQSYFSVLTEKNAQPPICGILKVSCFDVVSDAFQGSQCLVCDCNAPAVRKLVFLCNDNNVSCFKDQTVGGTPDQLDLESHAWTCKARGSLFQFACPFLLFHALGFFFPWAPSSASLRGPSTKYAGPTHALFTYVFGPLPTQISCISLFHRMLPCPFVSMRIVPCFTIFPQDVEDQRILQVCARFWSRGCLFAIHSMSLKFQVHPWCAHAAHAIVAFRGFALMT